MKALRDQRNYLRHMAPRIDRDESSSSSYDWILYGDDGSIRAYVEDDDYELVEFDDADLPEDYFEDKYWLIDGEFVVDPQWGTPAPSFKYQIEVVKQSVARANQAISDADNAIASIRSQVVSVDSKYEDIMTEAEEALCDIDESISERISEIEEALVELAEMMK